jgi:hypothetical protein
LFFNNSKSQDWELTDKKINIKYKDKEYVSQIAKKDNLICYYIKEKDNLENIIGDQEDEYEDYKKIAIASRIYFNKTNTLSKIEKDLEMFKKANRMYKTGIFSNKVIVELTELDTKMLLSMGGDFSIKDYATKRFFRILNDIKGSFIDETRKDKTKVTSLGNFLKIMKKKMFDVTAVESKDNIGKLKEVKDILLRNNPLTVEEYLESDSLISNCLIKGNSLAEFQYSYLEKINDIGFQLINIGSTMLKSFHEGQELYKIVDKLGLYTIEDIQGEAIKLCMQDMRKVAERTTLSLNLYKKNFDLNNSNSLAYKMIKQFTKKEEVKKEEVVKEEKIEDKINRDNEIRQKQEINKELEWFNDRLINTFGGRYIFNGNRMDNTYLNLYISAGTTKKSDSYGENEYIFAILKDNFKKIDFKKCYIKFNIEPSEFYKFGDEETIYFVGFGPEVETIYNNNVKSDNVFIGYLRTSLDKMADWNIEIDREEEKIKIYSNSNINVDISLPIIKDISNFENLYLKIGVRDFIDPYGKGIGIMLTNFKYEIEY